MNEGEAVPAIAVVPFRVRCFDIVSGRSPDRPRGIVRPSGGSGWRKGAVSAMDAQRSSVATLDDPIEDRHLSDGYAASHPTGKQEWVQQHAHHMLQHWLKWGSPLGIAPSYVAKLERDLAKCYDQPLLKAFIERTY